ncbi:MAG: glycosyltransferase [Rhizomicrobium sp.]
MRDAPEKRGASVLIIERDEYPPFRVDVVELFCNGLAFAGMTIDWFMISRDNGIGGVFLAEPNQRYFVGGVGGAGWIPVSVRRGWNVLRNRLHAAYRAVFGNYDIVQVRDLPIIGIIYLIAARLSGKKFVFWLSFPMIEMIELNAIIRRHSLHPINVLVRIAVSRAFRPIFYRIVLANSDHVFVQSARMQEDIAKMGVRHGRITPVPMCVRIAKFNSASIDPKSDNRAAGKKMLVYVGSMEPVRRVDEMIRVLAILTKSGLDGVLFIVGGYRRDDYAALLSVAEKEGVSDRLFFTGHLPLAVALAYVRRADVCLSPYPTDFIHGSGTPTKLVEYLAMGRPVIANSHPDQSAVIQASGAGVCVPLTASDFAQAAITLLSNEALASEMSSKGPPWVRANRSYEAMVLTLLEKYKEILARTSWRVQ